LMITGPRRGRGLVNQLIDPAVQWRSGSTTTSRRTPRGVYWRRARGRRAGVCWRRVRSPAGRADGSAVS
jgi:hypothetical protein